MDRKILLNLQVTFLRAWETLTTGLHWMISSLARLPVTSWGLMTWSTWSYLIWALHSSGGLTQPESRGVLLRLYCGLSIL